MPQTFLTRNPKKKQQLSRRPLNLVSHTYEGVGLFQVGSYRSRSLIEGLYTLQKPYGSPIYPKTPHL